MNKELRKIRLQRAAERKVRIHKAMELRLAGYSYQEIADAGIYNTAMAAFKAVDKVLTKTIEEPAKKIVDLEIKRLDRLLVVFHKKAITGDLAAADRVMRIMERRAKYKGLDAAEKFEMPDMKIVVEVVDKQVVKKESDEQKAIED